MSPKSYLGSNDQNAKKWRKKPLKFVFAPNAPKSFWDVQWSKFIFCGPEMQKNL